MLGTIHNELNNQLTWLIYYIYLLLQYGKADIGIEFLKKEEEY